MYLHLLVLMAKAHCATAVPTLVQCSVEDKGVLSVYLAVEFARFLKLGVVNGQATKDGPPILLLVDPTAELLMVGGVAITGRLRFANFLIVRVVDC